MRLKIYSFGILLVIWLGTGFPPRNAQSLATNNDCAFWAFTCTGFGGVKILYTKQKELLKFWFPVQIITYHMVRYLPQLSVVQQSHRFVWGGGEAGGCCFDFKVLCIKLPLNCCHHNACEPVCCVSLTGTNPRKYCPLSSPHSCCVSSKLGWTLGPYLTCRQTRPFKPSPGKIIRDLILVVSTLLLLSVVRSKFASQLLGYSSCQKGK